MRYSISYWCVSHSGRLRRKNQDNFICNGSFMPDGSSGAELSGAWIHGKRVLFGVFDGLGGEECGEVAALIAAECAAGLKLGNDPAYDLSEFCRTANRRICSFAESNSVISMGTTAALLEFTESGFTMCNIGDSKVFWYSNGKLQQISMDHLAGAPYGRKPPLSQNLGIPEHELLLEPYLTDGGCRPGDIFLICSDGLTDMVPADDIADVLRSAPAGEAAEILLDSALANGGRDNVTLIICNIAKAPGFLKRLSARFRRNGGEGL